MSDGDSEGEEEEEEEEEQRGGRGAKGKPSGKAVVAAREVAASKMKARR